MDNASIYGVMRRAALERALPMPNALAGDWMLIGRLLMSGKLATVPETVVHRSVGGTSASLRGTARSMGLTRAEERHPHLAMARMIRRDIATGAPAMPRSVSAGGGDSGCPAPPRSCARAPSGCSTTSSARCCGTRGCSAWTRRSAVRCDRRAGERPYLP